MTAVWTLVTLWLGLALIASLLSAWLRVSTALTEIVVGTLAQLIIGTPFGATALGIDEPKEPRTSHRAAMPMANVEVRKLPENPVYGGRRVP